MATAKIETIGAVSAIVSGLVWLALTPFMATIGICGGSCLSWADQPLVVRTLGRVVADQGWLSFAAPETLYFGYGRFFFLVYVLVILGLMALHRAQIQRVARQSRLGDRAYHVLLVSLVVAAVGDFTSYGIGVFSEAAWRVGFGVEAVAWLGIMLGALLYGFAILQRRAVHPAIGWLLIVAALLMPATFFDRMLVQYAPNAQLLPFAVVWPIVGVYLLAGRRQTINAKR
jgi:hypothetical protein